MPRSQSNRIGISALAVYAVLTVATAVLLVELGSKPLGYTSLAGLLIPAAAEDHAARQRYGKMRIRSDQLGHCREYSLDNTTQQIVLSGEIVCDHDRVARVDSRSRTEIIRDAFRGH